MVDLHDTATRIADEGLGGTESDAADEAETEPVRVVSVVMNGADLRATIGRLLLFNATGVNAGFLANLRLDFSESWLLATASDGYTFGIQKMRCEADSAGTLLLSAYDAARIAALVPKPGKDGLTEDIAIEFTVGGGPKTKRTVLARYTEAGRTGTHFCVAEQLAPTAPGLVFARFSHYESANAHWAIHPTFLVQVAKAVAIAKDQEPFVVRWYLTEEHVSKTSDELVEGPLIARFSVMEQHDEFIALLMPVGVTWADGDEIARVIDRVQDVDGEAQRLRPKPNHIDAGEGGQA